MDRITFWWKALRRGASQLNSAAGWFSAAVLILGIAGIVVPLVFQLSPLVIAVVLVSLLVAVIAEGSYRVWHDTERAKETAETDLNTANGKLADLRKAQAERVQVLRDAGLPPISMSSSFGTGEKRRERVRIRVANNSDRVIRDLIFYWREGAAPWDSPDRVDYLESEKDIARLRDFPDDLPADRDKNLFSADVYFKDANQVWWRATPDGELAETTSPPP